MSIFRITGATLAAVVLASSVSAASPEREAAGWAKWVDFGQGILDAREESTIGPLNQACKGVRGMLISQGFQFPYWAQQQMMLCDGLSAIAKGDRKDACKTLKSASKELGKAKPVVLEPRAEPMASSLKRIADDAVAINHC